MSKKPYSPKIYRSKRCCISYPERIKTRENGGTDMKKHSGRIILGAFAAFSVISATALAAGQDLDSLMKLKPGRSRAATSTDPSFTGNADRVKYIAPGETKVLADGEGPGGIRHIWRTFTEARPNWLQSGGSAAPPGNRPR